MTAQEHEGSPLEAAPGIRASVLRKTSRFAGAQQGKQKMTTYTPGPWKTVPNYSYVIRNEGDHDGVICRMAYNGSHIQWACDPASLENSANARLIAAAPELAEELSRLVAEIAEYNPVGINLDRARTLLAGVSDGDDGGSTPPRRASRRSIAHEEDDMNTVSVPAGTTIHCNRCDAAFALAKDVQRTMFSGTRAARLTCFAQCPHCGKSDKHWINLIDAAPEFSGTDFQQLKALLAWAAAN